MNSSLRSDYYNFFRYYGRPKPKVGSCPCSICRLLDLESTEIFRLRYRDGEMRVGIFDKGKIWGLYDDGWDTLHLPMFPENEGSTWIIQPKHLLPDERVEVVIKLLELL